MRNGKKWLITANRSSYFQIKYIWKEVEESRWWPSEKAIHRKTKLLMVQRLWFWQLSFAKEISCRKWRAKRVWFWFPCGCLALMGVSLITFADLNLTSFFILVQIDFDKICQINIRNIEIKVIDRCITHS